MKDKYPEHEKLKEIQPDSQKIGEFLEWLQDEKRLELCHFVGDELVPSYTSKMQLLAEFFEIDQKKIEEEKQAMIDEMRRLNESDAREKAETGDDDGA